MKTKFKDAAMYTYSPSYTFPGNLPEEIFRRPTVGTPPIDAFAQIRQGIRTDEYLILQTEIEKILTAQQGCNPTYSTSGTFSDRKLSVAKFEVNQSWCKSDWEATASVLTNDPTWMADGMDGFQLTQKLNAAIDDALIDAIRRDIWRILLFGNTTAASSNYNMLEGIIGKLFDGFSSYCVQKINDTDFPKDPNAILGTDVAYNGLKATYTGANIVLKQIDASQKVFWVNGAIYENLLSSYESKTNGATELQFRMILDGVPMGIGEGDGAGKSSGNAMSGVLTYRGIPVIPLYIADKYLADSTNPWYNNLANFIIYTTKGTSRYANHVIGVENAADLNRIDTFYDGRLKTVYKQGNMRFGYNFINCNLTAFHF